MSALELLESEPQELPSQNPNQLKTLDFEFDIQNKWAESFAKSSLAIIFGRELAEIGGFSSTLRVSASGPIAATLEVLQNRSVF